MNKTNGLDLLGDQLVNAQKFWEAGLQPTFDVHDPVRDQTVSIAEVFTKLEDDETWIMSGDSLPGTLTIKALLVNKEGILLETAPLDRPGVDKLIKDHMLAFSLRKGGLVDMHTRKQVVKLTESTQRHVLKMEDETAEIGPRCLWTIKLGDLTENQRTYVIRLADLLFTADTFTDAGVEIQMDEPMRSVAQVQKMGMRLELSFQQQLTLEQRPLLALRQKQITDVTVMTSQRLELQQLFHLERRILTMTEEELIAFVAQMASEKGPGYILNAMIWTIAGKIKAVRPSLSYKEARRIARKLARK